MSTVELTRFFKMIVSRAVLASWWSKTDPPEVIREVSTFIFMHYIQTCLIASFRLGGGTYERNENEIYQTHEETLQKTQALSS